MIAHIQQHRQQQNMAEQTEAKIHSDAVKSELRTEYRNDPSKGNNNISGGKQKTKIVHANCQWTRKTTAKRNVWLHGNILWHISCRGRSPCERCRCPAVIRRELHQSTHKHTCTLTDISVQCAQAPRAIKHLRLMWFYVWALASRFPVCAGWVSVLCTLCVCIPESLTNYLYARTNGDFDRQMVCLG